VYFTGAPQLPPQSLATPTSRSEHPMSQPQNDKKDDLVRIDLNDAQKAQVKSATGKEVESVELKVQELEERIAPRMAY
jgi:hypothetical protein